MVVNNDTSVGITEDIITNIMHLCASEYHLNILIRKYVDQMTFWYNDGVPELQSTSDKEKVMELEELVGHLTLQLGEVTEARREAMRLLKAQSTQQGNADLWCLVKHVLTATITSFEAWQVNLGDGTLQDIFIKQSRIANQVIALFLGYEVTPCSACLTDQMK